MPSINAWDRPQHAMRVTASSGSTWGLCTYLNSRRSRCSSQISARQSRGFKEKCETTCTWSMPGDSTAAAGPDNLPRAAQSVQTVCVPWQRWLPHSSAMTSLRPWWHCGVGLQSQCLVKLWTQWHNTVRTPPRVADSVCLAEQLAEQTVLRPIKPAKKLHTPLPLPAPAAPEHRQCQPLLQVSSHEMSEKCHNWNLRAEHQQPACNCSQVTSRCR